MKKFLMTKVIEKLLSTTIMKEIQGINSVVVLDKKGMAYMQTEGVNFDILHKFPFLDETKVRSNDIQAISKKFGVSPYLCRYKLQETFLYLKS
jgi:galactitol-specific phosphotransferase system IIC component